MATTAAPVTLKTALGDYGHTLALRDGTLSSERVRFDYEDVTPILRAFPRMAALEPEFDLAEMAFSTYLLARAHGRRITALPIFPLRGFHHGAMIYRAASGIAGPAGLAGRRVGLRSMGQTTGVWVRGILASQYGLDLGAVTWVLVEQEHVREFVPQGPNIEKRPGANLMDMLGAGDIDATLAAGRFEESDEVKILIPEPMKAAHRWFRDEGIYPINHAIVVRDELLEANPWLAAEVFSLFQASKEAYVRRLERDGPAMPADQSWQSTATVVGDPLVHGLAPNRKVLDTIIGFARAQSLLTEDVALDDLFAAGTHELE